MTNHEAILKLNPEGMESFLDQVFIAGLNTGNYAAGIEDEQQAGLLGMNPFDMAWLNEPAEPALTGEENKPALAEEQPNNTVSEHMRKESKAVIGSKDVSTKIGIFLLLLQSISHPGGSRL